ncbi:DpnII family type II restriction endonuclease [Spiroplasma floricola]|uniref:Site-specific DNA-methyltransferase (adenine-specific) n=1 Tax=Spiroplasma floricola 23-6 TaxID=1336749 RepID=A0A2K8SEY9_9MOLU|nr:DpnII family type II restriction endonuclease [Spiroplasma floricola]AUB32019.1 DNA adenine methylase [Spiroplasma floricola 23-6]
MNKEKIAPFVKWVGGKRQLLEILNIFLPEKINNYFEPFLGGGAVFLDLLPQKAVLSDVNFELITTWKVIKSNSSELMNLLSKYVKEHNKNGKDYYYKLRDKDPNKLSEIQIAARFIYLNKTCFNGLYRVNKNNKFNTPFNNKEIIKESTIFDSKNLLNISKFLNKNNIEILNDDFEEILNKAKKDDFIFLDPPYDFDNKGFDSYTSNSFGKEGQIRLNNFLINVDKKGVKWILTNHNTELINELYKNFNIYRIPVNRFINSDSDNRQNSTFETIITNYILSKEQEYKLNQTLFFKELKSTSYILKKYVSWDKIKDFLSENKILINDLNILFSQDIKEFRLNFNDIFKNRRECLKLIPILLANNNIKNKKEPFTYIDNKNTENQFNLNDKDDIFNFMDESGLINNLFVNSEYKDIKTYLFGLKVGLSSHDKKNKSGKFMSDFIKELLISKDISFEKEVSQNKILGEAMLKEDKRFDFVFKIKDITYCLECNFFNDSGSKMNSELPRFIRLEDKFKDFKKYQFIYVADGPGLRKNRDIVINALDRIENMFNLFRFEKYLDSIAK